MTVQITRQSEAFVHSLVAAGAYANEAAVVEEALRLLQHRDQLRAEIRQGLEELERGERISSDEVFREIRNRIEKPLE